MDTITFSVLQSAFKSIADEMNINMFRSAYSAVITEGRDIGAALFNGNGNLIVQGESDLGVFVTMMQYSVRKIVEVYEGNLFEGDVFINNDPFIGGTHFNDVGVIKPVFYKGKRIGFVAIAGHWADVGGSTPGSLNSVAEEHFEEGLRIPPVKIMERGVMAKGVHDIIMSNVRIPWEREGDLSSQISSVAIGERRVIELADKYGVENILEFMEETIEYAKVMLEKEIDKIPDGSYFFEEYMDEESKYCKDPVKIAVKMTVKGNRMEFDFSGSDPQTRSAANGTYSSTVSAVIVTIKSLFPDVPMSYGCFLPISFIIPEGTVVNARPPAAISAMAGTVYEKVIGVSLGALAHACPEKSTGCPHGLINLVMGGVDDKTGEYYVMYLFSEGGFGGRATKDGSSGLVSLFGGGARITPVEVFERKYPILFNQWSLRQDSGGPGRFRGGNGSIKRFVIARGTAKLSALGDREKFPPWGLFGGKPAMPQGLVLNMGTEREVNLTLKASNYLVKEGDEVTVLVAGGGGYGDPLERDYALAEKDFLHGLLSSEHLYQEYGIVIDDQDKVDTAASDRLRAEMREAAE
ncbi:MAG: hydantoinase B/oxoprolinase family protein [Clostridiaceae bacterium]|jgi:N-methylhydantoinase B|nr:hydantoinase B/oxoprolinase family protein [Clostridiaceae bacterium]